MSKLPCSSYHVYDFFDVPYATRIDWRILHIINSNDDESKDSIWSCYLFRYSILVMNNDILVHKVDVRNFLVYEEDLTSIYADRLTDRNSLRFISTLSVKHSYHNSSLSTFTIGTNSYNKIPSLNKPSHF